LKILIFQYFSSLSVEVAGGGRNVLDRTVEGIWECELFLIRREQSGQDKEGTGDVDRKMADLGGRAV